MRDEGEMGMEGDPMKMIVREEVEEGKRFRVAKAPCGISRESLLRLGYSHRTSGVRSELAVYRVNC